MSIIIRSNELNTIVYKYLLEAGLSHTAYTMFNEARLQSSLQEFKFDIKSGHLLMLLQKALVFNQIQSHVNFSEYKECLQPFYLLKSHTCKISEKIQQQKKNLLKQLNENLTESIKRTNAIYNTQLSNKMYDEIVYEPRGSNYFQKFYKLKFNEKEKKQDSESVSINAIDQKTIAIHDQGQKIIYLTHNDLNSGQTIIQKVYPTVLNGQLTKLQVFKLTPTHLIMVFSNNIISNSSMSMLNVPLISQISSINFNEKFPSLIAFHNSCEFSVINIKNMQVITYGNGLIGWRSFDQYIQFSNSRLFLKSILTPTLPILSYHIQQDNVDQIRVSTNKSFFFVLNYKRGKIQVFTFQKEQPLYEFNFARQEEDLKQVIWIYRNQVDYLAILTDLAIRVWEVEFNAYSFKADLQKYNSGQILSLNWLQKNQNDTYLLALGQQNLLVCDIANQKVQRIQSPNSSCKMHQIGRTSVALTNSESIYFMTGDKLADLFK